MSRITSSQLTKGMFIDFKNRPHQVMSVTFVNPGKGSAFVKSRLKDVDSSKVQEFTFKSGESVEELPVTVREMQYLYKETEKMHFMDRLTYEQYNTPADTVGLFSRFMKEGEVYQVLVHGNDIIGMRYPKKVKLTVTDAQEGAKGNTVSGAKKEVLLETGIRVTVPLFIKTGDSIYLDSESGEYQERVKN